MHREGFSFNSWGFGGRVEANLRDDPFMSATVSDRLQPFATVRRRQYEIDMVLPLGKTFGGLGWKHEVSDLSEIA